MVAVPYPNFSPVSGLEAGVELLDKMIRATPGRKVVFGHSMGARVGCWWLNRCGPGSEIDPAELEFVLIGNSERKYGGVLYPWWAAPIPADTTFRVLDVARQYDGWADWPDDLGNGEAVWNALVGQNTVHPYYEQVNIFDSANAVHAEGNVRYMWVPTRPLPVLGTTRNAWIDQLDAAKRPAIEAGYRRPIGAL